jgi:hypothetical protein
MTCQLELLVHDLLGYGWLMRVAQPSYMRQGVGRRGGRVGAVSAMVLVGSTLPVPQLVTTTSCHSEVMSCVSRPTRVLLLPGASGRDANVTPSHWQLLTGTCTASPQCASFRASGPEGSHADWPCKQL